MVGRSSLVIFALPAIALVACGGSGLSDAARRAALDRSLAAIDPDAEPLPPQAPPLDGNVAFNTEYYLGSAEEEAAQFRAYSEQIQSIQRQAAADHGQPIQRGFHAKAHACLRGTFKPAADRAPRTRFGIFRSDEARPVWVRFSNGVGWKQADTDLDARGMAIKVMGVPGPKYLPEETDTQDFLMTNTPTPVGANAVDFMKFAQANTDGRIAGIFFLLGHLRVAGGALTRTAAVDSMVTEQYWSGGAYHLGAHQAVKFTALPCNPYAKRQPDRDDDDYLRKDLVDAAKEGICMRFYVQFQVDPVETPIENASREWSEEKSPLVAVGTVEMPPQSWGTDAERAACDQLTFSPWHSLPAHKPMGHINRARRYVYHASQQQRGAGTGGAPHP